MISRGRNRVRYADGRVIDDAPVWIVDCPLDGVPGEYVIHDQGGWRSATSLVRVVLTAAAARIRDLL